MVTFFWCFQNDFSSFTCRWLKVDLLDIFTYEVLNLLLDGRKPTMENDTWRCQFIHIPVINQTHLWLYNHLLTNKLSNKQQKNSNWHQWNNNIFNMLLYRIDQFVVFLAKLATYFKDFLMITTPDLLLYVLNRKGPFKKP